MCFSVFIFAILCMFNPIDANEGTTAPSFNKNCTVRHGLQLLKEGEDITINRKLYKVEDCHLQRAYQACGTHLWFMLNIVCEAVEVQKGRNRIPSRFRRFAEEDLFSEACCQKICTVAEMTRYCP
jgi:hypothetical protein